MITFGQFIILLIVLGILGIVFKEDNSDIDYHNYNCYDKSLHKCLKCRKKCKWHYIAKKSEELQDKDI